MPPKIPLSFRAKRVAQVVPIALLFSNVLEYFIGANWIYRSIFASSAGCSNSTSCNFAVTIPALCAEDMVLVAFFVALFALRGVFESVSRKSQSISKRGR